MPATVPFVCLSIQLCFNYTANVFVITVMLKNEGGASFVPLLYRSKKNKLFHTPKTVIIWYFSHISFLSFFNGNK